jgi:hypothetical protein
VAHPDLIPIAMKALIKGCRKNQIHNKRTDVQVTKDLLELPEGTITEDGVRKH